MEDQLDHARAVAQVDEDQAAVVAAAVDPSGDPRLRLDAIAEHLAAPGVAVAVGAQRREACRGALIHPSRSRRSELLDQIGRVYLALLAAESSCREAAPSPSASRMTRVRGADPVRMLQLALEAPPAEVELGRDPALRSSPASASARARWPSSAAATESVSRAAVAPRRSSSARRIRSIPAAQPTAGVGGPPELLDQTVVTAAPADLGLRAERGRMEREDRSRVVVEPAHQGPVDRVSDPGRVEQPRTAARCSASSASRAVEHRRRLGHHRPGPLVLGVEGAQRVQRRSAPAPRFESSPSLRAQVGDQLLAGSRRRDSERAEAAEPQLDPRHPEAAQQLVEQDDHLGVDERRLGADRLGAELVELAVAAGLGSLVAEERPPYQSFTGWASFCMPCST